MISLIVPVANDGAERDRNWAWCRERWPTGWELVEAPDIATGPTWSKGRAVNAAVERAHGDTFVIADSDVFLDAYAIAAALLALTDGVPWVVPHHIVNRLGRRETIQLIARGTPNGLHGRRHKGPAGGGVVILRRDAFEKVRGIDPRFTGWGGEDEAFGRALDTLVGPHLRLDGPLWHLWHQPLARHPGRRASPENEQLAARYLDASGDVEMMALLVCDSARLRA